MRLGCGIQGMLGLEPGSVDLVLCDLPSGETAAKFDVPVSLPDFWRASWQCLKPTGIVVVMASSFRFAVEVHQSQPKAFRYDIIWSKDKGTGFLSSGNRPLRSHEFVLVFWSETGTYNVQMVETGIPIAKNTQGKVNSGENYGNLPSGTKLSRAGATDRFPRSVIEEECIGVQNRARVHPQQKPDDLFRRLIRMYSNPGELAVDPCAGSGTTERAALAEGRRAICWDIQERFGKRKGAQILIGEDLGNVAAKARLGT